MVADALRFELKGFGIDVLVIQPGLVRTRFGRAAHDRLRGAQLAPGLRVLDLASGTGQPAITIAQAVGPTGQVTASDLAPEMVANLKQNAGGIANLDARGIRHAGAGRNSVAAHKPAVLKVGGVTVAILAYEYLNFHKMAIFAGIAVVVLFIIARFLISRL